MARSRSKYKHKHKYPKKEQVAYVSTPMINPATVKAIIFAIVLFICLIAAVTPEVPIAQG
ncbi:MAG: hypothetical protein ACTID4_15115 [Hafnia alvei]|uniref:hypothetical protein n=1 Tax=Hafnia alvei TaxID=569 RepID=UPI003F8DB0BD